MDREISLPKDFAGRVFINGVQVWPVSAAGVPVAVVHDSNYAHEDGVVKQTIRVLRNPLPEGAELYWGQPAPAVSVPEYVRDALELLLEVSDIAPEPNCACHISGPCSDCVEWAGLREARKYAKEMLAAAPQPEAPK